MDRILDGRLPPPEYDGYRLQVRRDGAAVFLTRALAGVPADALRRYRPASDYLEAEGAFLCFALVAR
jgi:hypothetical protein